MSGDDMIESDKELTRLQSLLGPDEESYAELRRQRDAAEARARELETQLGELRGRVKRLDQMMWRRTRRRQRVSRIAQRVLRR